MNTPNPNGRPFSAAGQKLDETIAEAAKRIEAETKQLLNYINDEVVPLVRQHSTTGLRDCVGQTERVCRLHGIDEAEEAVRMPGYTHISHKKGHVERAWNGGAG